MRFIKSLAAFLAGLVCFSTAGWAVESANGTVLPTATSITDFYGRTWTLTNDTNRAVKLNGVATNLTNIQEVWYLDHQIYAIGGGQWWQFVNVWSPTPTAVAITTMPPLPTTPGLRAPTGPQTGVACTGVAIAAGADIQAAVNANPAGTTFCLAAGTYSGQSVTPLAGDTFIGAFDGTNYAVMDGGGMLSPVVTSVVGSGSGGSLPAGNYWYAVTAINGTGETMASSQWNVVTTGSTSSVTLTWAAVTGATGYHVWRGDWNAETSYYAPGNVTTYTDTGAAPLTGTLPTFNSASPTSTAFNGTANYITIRNMKIQNYNQGVQVGSIDLSGNYIVVQNNLIQFATSGAGVRLQGASELLLSNHLYSNAEEGYSFGAGAAAGDGVGNIMDNNDIDTNNPTNGLWDSGEEGGGKAVANSYFNVWYNYSHGNGGPGFWTDYANTYINYIYNQTANNMGAGIEHEISYNALIKGNLMTGDGADPNCPNSFAACGEVQIENSGGLPAGNPDAGFIEVVDNIIKPGLYGRSIYGRDQNRGNGTSHYSSAPYNVQNLWVHNNFIDMSNSNQTGQVGIETDWGNNMLYNYYNNRFDYNTYLLNGPTPFHWLTKDLTDDGTWTGTWQASGQDLHGSLIP